MKKRRKKRKEEGGDGGGEGRYVCPTCGEEIVIPVDVTLGREQKYVEDCPVCCHPNVIHVEWEEGWDEARVWAEAE